MKYVKFLGQGLPQNSYAAKGRYHIYSFISAINIIE